MGGQGFPFEGADHRVFGFFAPLVRALSWSSDKQPPSLIFTAIGFRLYVPLWIFGKDGFFMIRAGWHYDATNRAYILGFAAKRVKDATLY